MTEEVKNVPPKRDRRLELYERLGRRVLPLVLSLLLLLWLALDQIYLLSKTVDKSLTFILQGPAPSWLRETLSFVKHYGVPGTLILFTGISIFPSQMKWLLPPQRRCGQAFILLADIFSRFGEFLFHRRKLAQAILWLCGTLTVVSLAKAYDRHQDNQHLKNLHSELKDEMLELVGGPVLHYRNRQHFDPIKDAMGATVRWDERAAKRMAAEKHPLVCLYGLLTVIHESKSEQWPQISKQIADLEETVPLPLRGKCRQWKEYQEQITFGDALYIDSLAGLNLAVAKVNERRSLEGSLRKATLKAAGLYLHARKLYEYTERALPERVALQSDNGLGNYFSACFARWPELGCDKRDERDSELFCNSPEDCYDKSSDYYTRRDSGFSEAAVSRRENNTVDLKMKALIRFAPPQIIPPYVQATLNADSNQGGSPLQWLERSTKQLESRAYATQVVPELYVTLSQLYAVQLFYLRANNPQLQVDKRLEVARKSIEYLEISHRLLGLDRDYFLFEVCHRGWCGLMQELEKSAEANEELRRRLIAVVRSLSQEDPEQWLLSTCRECQRMGRSISAIR